jgi:hypothetical protein
LNFDPDWDHDEGYDGDMFDDGNPDDGMDNVSDHGSDIDDEAHILGLALGFGDFISSERMKDLSELTPETDAENILKASELCPVHTRHSNVSNKKRRPFERFVDDLCAGKLSIDDSDY